MEHVAPKIEESWKKVLEAEFNSDYFKKIKHFLVEEKGNRPFFLLVKTFLTPLTLLLLTK